MVRPQKFLADQQANEKESKNRFESVPANATVREENVRCKKYTCYTCPHGPYYYAYWKENGKLKKKYIGNMYNESWKTSSKSDGLITAIQSNNEELLKAIENRKPDELLDSLSKKRN
jgi:hypothetical protein